MYIILTVKELLWNSYTYLHNYTYLQNKIYLNN